MLRLDWKIQLAFGFAMLGVLLMGALSYAEMSASRESDLWVRHTHEILEQIQNLRLGIEGISANSRGFVLTGDESDFDLYRASVLKFEQEQAALRKLTADNPVTEGMLSTLEALTAARVQRSESIIALRRSQGLLAAVAVSQDGTGQRLTNELQAVVGNIQDEELGLSVQRTARTQQHLKRAKIALIAGTVLALIIVGAAGWSTQRDSSRRRHAEAALRDGEKRYRMLLDGIPDYAIFMLDPLGQILTWNAGAERVKGYTAAEIMGQSFSRFFPAGDIRVGRPEGILRRAAATGQHNEYGMRVRKDGSQFLASITITALRDPAGYLRGFSEISHDLTKIQAAEDRYRGLLEAAPDAMVVVDQGGEIVLLNVQAEKQFGYSRDELLGQPVTNIIPEGFAERLIADGTRTMAEALAQVIGTGIELSGLRKDGSRFPIEIMLSPLEGAEGIMVTAAIRNITVRKAAEKHLAQMVEELKTSNEELGQFAYIASHDLQEPLRMVASYTQLLSIRYKGKLDSDADEFIAFAVDGANRMKRLIQDLLSYSRVGTKGGALLDISSEQALQQALINLRMAIKGSGALVTHDPLPGVLADESQLTQLFQNLIGNAIKFQRPGVPRIHISAVRNGGEKWRFSVQDNGLGIEPQYFEQIFGMFQRLHRREEFSGTGIGLAICKKIVERHGGAISVESQPEQGSTFHFTLVGSEQHSWQSSEKKI